MSAQDPRKLLFVRLPGVLEPGRLHGHGSRRSSIAPVLASVDHVLTSVSDVLASITYVLAVVPQILATIEPILESITSSTVVQPVQSILSCVTDVFASIPEVLAPVENILAAVAYVLTPISQVFPAVPNQVRMKGTNRANISLRLHVRRCAGQQDRSQRGHSKISH